jgi:hypothetical protein
MIGTQPEKAGLAVINSIDKSGESIHKEAVIGLFRRLGDEVAPLFIDELKNDSNFIAQTNEGRSEVLSTIVGVVTNTLSQWSNPENRIHQQIIKEVDTEDKQIHTKDLLRKDRVTKSNDNISDKRGETIHKEATIGLLRRLGDEVAPLFIEELKNDADFIALNNEGRSIALSAIVKTIANTLSQWSDSENKLHKQIINGVD